MKLKIYLVNANGWASSTNIKGKWNNKMVMLNLSRGQTMRWESLERQRKREKRREMKTKMHIPHTETFTIGKFIGVAIKTKKGIFFWKMQTREIWKTKLITFLFHVIFRLAM